MSDTIHRFIFDNYAIRGELVKLDESSQRMIEGHDYPPFIATLLQQAAAVTTLLATTLKFEGKISLQLVTPEDLKMLVVQTSHKLSFRGVARYEEESDYSDMSFADLKNGQMSITIEPLKGKRYQGIVPLNGQNLAECIENYFIQSEQLQTRIWLFNNDKHVCGLMLQALPDMNETDDFDHLVHLASTLSEEESLSVDSDTLLHRLFHQESIKNLAADPVRFECGCSREKMLNSVSLLPQDQLDELFSTREEISVKCEFCLKLMRFSKPEIQLSRGVTGNETLH